MAASSWWCFVAAVRASLRVSVSCQRPLALSLSLIQAVLEYFQCSASAEASLRSPFAPCSLGRFEQNSPYFPHLTPLAFFVMQSHDVWPRLTWFQPYLPWNALVRPLARRCTRWRTSISSDNHSVSLWNSSEPLSRFFWGPLSTNVFLRLTLLKNTQHSPKIPFFKTNV